MLGESRAVAIISYTLLRVALFVAVWLVLELLTPIHGIVAIAIAIVMSGAISLVVLDRQRGAVGTVAAGFFGRINERIEASARAEDVDDEDDSLPSTPDARPPSTPDATSDEASGRGSGHGQEGPECESVDQQQ